MKIIHLPKNLNVRTMRGVFERIKENAKIDRNLMIDLSNLNFIDTCGMTGLASIMKGFSMAGVEFNFSGLDSDSLAVKYMHACGFVNSITDYKTSLELRDSTLIPFMEISNTNHVKYIQFDLKDWILREMSLSKESVEVLCACISEAFQNVEHHAGGSGFGVAQIYQARKELHISVSDCGIGIPAQVRSIYPEISDAEALKKSCERGFTTKTNYTNRGFGIDNLIQYTVKGNGGNVMIRSFGASLISKPGAERSHPFILANSESWSYPGTLVKVCLRTDKLEESEDHTQEEFTWDM